MRAVEYRNDDDQHDSVGSSKLEDFGAFRDPAEPVSGGDGNGGLRGFFGVKLELDFHCHGRREERRLCRTIILGMKKSSIDGTRYLDYLWELSELQLYIYWWCWQFASPISLQSVHSGNQGIFNYV